MNLAAASCNDQYLAAAGASSPHPAAAPKHGLPIHPVVNRADHDRCGLANHHDSAALLLALHQQHGHGRPRTATTRNDPPRAAVIDHTYRTPTTLAPQP